MPKDSELVKISPGNAGSGRVTISKYLLKKLGKKPGEYLMPYVGEVEIPESVANEVGCEQNSRARAIIYIPVTIKFRDSDNDKTK